MGIKDIIKPIGSQSFVVGFGVAALTYFLGPQLKQAFRPIAVKGAQGVLNFGSKTVKAFGESKDKLSNILSEKTNEATKIAENTNEEIDSKTIIKELQAERESSNKILMELINSISGLKDELKQLQNNGNLQQG